MDFDFTTIKLLIKQSKCKKANKMFQNLEKINRKKTVQLVTFKPNKYKLSLILRKWETINNKLKKEVFKFKSWLADENIFCANKFKIEAIHLNTVIHAEKLIASALQMQKQQRMINLEAFCVLYGI